jgi:hypothetical protein
LWRLGFLWYYKIRIGTTSSEVQQKGGLMNVSTTYEFENKEDREEAFHNIVKWFGANIVEKIDTLRLAVKGPEDVRTATSQIVEKHEGRCQL